MEKTQGLKSLRENQPIAKSDPQGRLNLAQDAVLGRDSKDEKSRRDDWNLHGGIPGNSFSSIPRLMIPDSLPESTIMSQITFSVVPAGLFDGACQPRTASWAKFSRPRSTSSGQALRDSGWNVGDDES